MREYHCDCGCVPPHGTPEECAQNREATRIYMASINSSNIDGGIARGKRLAQDHDQHLRPHYGCDLCPLDGRFVRDSSAGEWYIP